MSKFKQLIQRHRDAELARAEARRLEEAEKQESQRKFTSDFRQVASSIVKPAFEQFVSELREEGLQASIDEYLDEKGNAAIAVRFTCEPNGGDECTVGLAANPALSMVQRWAHIGRDAPPDGGASHRLDAITGVFVQQKLSDALERGLKRFASADVPA